MDLHNRWPHRWITPKAQVQDSPIHDKGMFATKPITKGEVVAVYGGIIVPASDIDSHREAVGGMRGIQIHDDFFICATEVEGGRFNHSCEPNLGYANAIVIVAMNAIPAGTELVFDYGMSESSFKPFTCSCNSRDCRTTITPDDWKLPALQKNHGPFFAPYLRKK